MKVYSGWDHGKCGSREWETCLLEVFNSATVYLKKMRKVGERAGKRCHPCLKSVVWGIFCCHQLHSASPHLLRAFVAIMAWVSLIFIVVIYTLDIYRHLYQDELFIHCTTVGGHHSWQKKGLNTSRFSLPPICFWKFAWLYCDWDEQRFKFQHFFSQIANKLTVKLLETLNFTHYIV